MHSCCQREPLVLQRLPNFNDCVDIQELWNVKMVNRTTLKLSLKVTTVISSNMPINRIKDDKCLYCHCLPREFHFLFCFVFFIWLRLISSRISRVFLFSIQSSQARFHFNKEWRSKRNPRQVVARLLPRVLFKSRMRFTLETKWFKSTTRTSNSLSWPLLLSRTSSKAIWTAGVDWSISWSSFGWQG